MNSDRAICDELRALNARIARLEGALSAATAVPRTLNTGQAARLLGVSKSRMVKLAADERLGEKAGRLWRLDGDKVLALKALREP